jgi:uncharacterized protein
MTKEQIIQAIIEYLSRYPIGRVSLFGSFARDQQRKKSDIDLLIQFKETIDLFTLANIRQDLCELTRRQVDIVTEKSLSEAFRSRIQNDLQIIYQA